MHMNSVIYVTPCSLVKVYPTFRRNVLPPFSGSKNKPNNQPANYVGLRHHVPPKRQWTYARLHGVASQKMVTAATTANLTYVGECLDSSNNHQRQARSPHGNGERRYVWRARGCLSKHEQQQYCHVIKLGKPRFGLRIGFVGHLQSVTRNNSDSLAELHTPKITVTTAHHKVFSVFTSRCLVAASNGERSSSSGFRNCPQPQLPASHFSQL
jgi:hypothetical protein